MSKSLHKNLTSIREKKTRISVYDKITDQIGWDVWDRVWDQVLEQVWRQNGEQVKIRIRDHLWHNSAVEKI